MITSTPSLSSKLNEFMLYLYTTLLCSAFSMDDHNDEERNTLLNEKKFIKMASASRNFVHYDNLTTAETITRKSHTAGSINNILAKEKLKRIRDEIFAS